MLKWVLAFLSVILLLKRSATPTAVTVANAAPPEGNISTWGNLSGVTGVPDSPAFGTTGNTGEHIAPAPIRYAPTTANFRTRGYYNDTGARYGIPGRIV